MLTPKRNSGLFNLYKNHLLVYDTNFFATQQELHNHSFFCKVVLQFDANYSKFYSQDLASFPQKEVVDPKSLSYYQRKNLANHVCKTSRLVSACKNRIVYAHLESLLFEAIYFGAKIVDVYQIIRSKAFPIFRKYILDLNTKRSTEKSAIHGRLLKSLSNSLAGD